ncbi:class I SAM-dependent methyltransferase [Photobacterium gaetbulicola]|uniref:Cyclopropane-fatty-acyl-phospholipid synthase n=1 Tax=Photobacterium gaetbulicola Gung47 TaxID=658445 RepID=A0A0C5W3E2_9GAMM|nr:cyclopropane-fatty-acyl-phospholipid synthase family protein [Photobacterium gaetbulicola]AJR05941.1 cyclopropane-fatty-acyl-phospholipid synthase [Photobacterium gaetbulicola Gung47]PSU13248.1 class I SAM-dependent methyltransferase [Photobacterium gaetbulicola]
MISSEVSQGSLALSGTDRVARKIVTTVLQQLTGCGLTVSEVHGETFQFGDKCSGLQAQLLVKHQGFYKRLLDGGSIAAGEAYMDGWWDSPDLTKVVQVLARNLPILDKIEAKVGWFTAFKNKWLHYTRRNNKQASKRNILAHYDLGNDFYRTFLDENMLYSAAIYGSEETSLSQAQFNKMDRLCQMLELKPTDHLLEIGTGWGALAIHAAKYYGCQVTTTTISDAQHKWARERIYEQGLEGKITLLLEDYRDLTGKYDKIVSVEMIEAVGKEYLTTYIKQCQSLLKEEGLLAIQAITIADQRFDSYSKGVDFIQKYIFPGGFLPSVTVLSQHLTQHTDFVIRDLKDIGMDYARTLSDWHKEFNNNIDHYLQQGFDEQFIRMWRYYLCYCEGGFLERSISTVQLVASRGGWR